MNVDAILEYVEKANNLVNAVVWGPLMLTLIIFVGVMFSIRLKFFQLFKCKLWLKQTFGSLFNKESLKGSKKDGITPFQAVSTALASTVGTGNVVGVATAITLGGPGAVFWMWIAAFFGMMTAFAENVLGLKYRTVNKLGEKVGGPMYYIEKGLRQRWMACFFAFACILASFGMGNMTQANSIAASLKKSFNLSPAVVGLVLAAIIGCIIFGGVTRVSQVTSKIVPFMTIFYILGGLIVIASHASNLPKAMFDIISGAFSLRAAGGGATGLVMANSIKYGISRGVFSNEAGLGSSPIVHAASKETEPVRQGMWGIFQVFVVTFFVCSITAFCILTSGVTPEDNDGAMLSVQAFSTTFGSLGEKFVAISISLFAFSTIVGWSYYGERCVEYLTSRKNILIYKALYILFVMFGSVMKLDLVWSISDTFNGLMAFPNLIALVLLSGEVVREYIRYRQKMSLH